MNDKTIEKPKRSITLTKKELRFLKDRVKESASITAAGLTLGISKDVLSRTIAFGSCSEKTYNTLFSKELEGGNSEESYGLGYMQNRGAA
jgi:hypothetical protein